MTGKEKCRLLRSVRADVARANDIPFTETECAHAGECAGTCPKCESDLRRLTQAVEKKRSLKKRVALAGVSLGVCAALTGCSSSDQPLDALKNLFFDNKTPEPTPGVEILLGEIDETPPDEPEWDELTGMVMPEEGVVYKPVS